MFEMTADQFYAWASSRIDRERFSWYSHPRFRSPFAYGSTRDVR